MNLIIILFSLVGIGFFCYLFMEEYQLWEPLLKDASFYLNSKMQRESRYKDIEKNSWMLKGEALFSRYEKMIFLILIIVLIIFASLGLLYDTLFPHSCGIGYCVFTP
jgi:hypothetical protein